MLRPISVMAVLCLRLPAILAHEGHGLPTHEHGVMHYVVNPSHGLPMLLTVAAATGLWFLMRRLRSSRKKQRLGMAMNTIPTVLRRSE